MATGKKEYGHTSDDWLLHILITALVFGIVG